MSWNADSWNLWMLEKFLIKHERNVSATYDINEPCIVEFERKE